MYDDNVHPTHVLIVKCVNGYGIDLCVNIDGEPGQRTYVAKSLDEAIDYVRKFFTEEGGIE